MPEDQDQQGPGEDYGAEDFFSFDSYEDLMQHLYGTAEEPDVEEASDESFSIEKASALPPVSRRANGGISDPTHAIQQANTKRRSAAMELRAQGYSYRQIAEKLNYYDANTAREAVLKGLDRLVIEPGKDMIGIELLRLDMMTAAIMPLASDPENPNLKAVDRMLKIMERRSKMLGLDAPKATDIRVRVEDEVRQLASKYNIDEALLSEVVVEADFVVKDENG